MEWQNEDIIASYNGIIRDAKNMNSAELETKYADFKLAFNKLYEVAIDSVINNTVQESYNLLTMMLKAREKMNTGKMTKMNTDMFVGNELGKKYIYPVTNTPSKDDYERAIRKIKVLKEEGKGP